MAQAAPFACSRAKSVAQKRAVSKGERRGSTSAVYGLKPSTAGHCRTTCVAYVVGASEPAAQDLAALKQRALVDVAAYWPITGQRLFVCGYPTVDCAFGRGRACADHTTASLVPT